jgi:hypothetical protein
MTEAALRADAEALSELQQHGRRVMDAAGRASGGVHVRERASEERQYR